MPTVPIDDLEQLTKVIGILDRLGGTYHGIGGRDECLIVDDRQYNELLKAGVVTDNGAKVSGHGKKKSKRRKKEL